ncbi:hypothetical protein Ahy_A04g020612 isoform B [Arachis hypogaea]|uniref:Uncharacterized protein n=1 Tax=Arachis hypogaea TaxID=3818 RepID=A0A445DI49_ARAHY|nr:hypothetical protein Ahy_A04g020612 isoform B [Arachis hypogaea]
MLKVMDIFIKAAEYMKIPVRRTDDEPLQKLFMLLRSELNLDLKNIKVPYTNNALSAEMVTICYLEGSRMF